MRKSDMELIDSKDIKNGELLILSSGRSDSSQPNMIGKIVDSQGNELYLTVWLRPGKSSFFATGFAKTKDEVIKHLEEYKLKMSAGNATDLMLKEIALRNNLEYKPSVERVDSMPKPSDFDDIP